LVDNAERICATRQGKSDNSSAIAAVG